jgi:thioredoxin-related protein
MKLIKIILAMFISLNLYASGDIDINVVAEDAKKTGKISMVFFHMTHCPYCNRMLEEMYTCDDMMNLLNEKFYYLDVNIDDDAIITYHDFKGTAGEFAEYLDISIYPTILFIDNDEIVYYVHGYRNKAKFAWILKYVASRSIGKMDLLEFINEEIMKEDD